MSTWLLHGQGFQFWHQHQSMAFGATKIWEVWMGLVPLCPSIFLYIYIKCQKKSWVTQYSVHMHCSNVSRELPNMIGLTCSSWWKHKCSFFLSFFSIYIRKSSSYKKLMPFFLGSIATYMYIYTTCTKYNQITRKWFQWIIVWYVWVV